MTPNDIVGSPDGKSFWFTNDHGSKTGFPRKLELYLAQAKTTVGYCHIDEGCKIAASKIPGANGMTRSRTNNTFYVGSATSGGVRIYERQADNTLLLVDFAASDGLPLDNLSVDSNGAVWAAAFPKGFHLLQRFKDITTNAASRAIRITHNPEAAESYLRLPNHKVEKIFEDDGLIAQGSTCVVNYPEKNLLFLNGISANHLTICNIVA